VAPPHLSNVLFLSAKALLDRKFSQSERLLPYAIGEEDEFRPKAENSAQQELQDFLYMVGGPEAEEQEDIDHLIDGPWVLHGHEDERDDTPDYACREAFFRMYSQGVHERNNGLVSPRSKYLRKTKELQIAPSPSGVVRSGEMDKIDLHCRGIGDDYATALAESFEGGDGVRSLNLRDNRLSVRGASSLLSSIVNSPEAIDELTELDLSYNRLSSETLRHLQTVISSAKGLTRLSLESAGLKDHHLTLNVGGRRLDRVERKSTHTAAKNGGRGWECLPEREATGSTELCLSILQSSTLHTLNLSYNSIGERYDGAEALAQLLEEHSSLTSLSLAWCKLRASSAVRLAQALRTNKTLVNLDLSWNAFGSRLKTAASSQSPLPGGGAEPGGGGKPKPGADQSGRASEAAEALALALAAHPKLRHLDLSYNSLDMADCEVIGEGLKKNHKLMGLHMDGNDCTVDSKGFVRPCLSAVDPTSGKSVCAPHAHVCNVSENWYDVEEHDDAEMVGAQEAVKKSAAASGAFGGKGKGAGHRKKPAVDPASDPGPYATQRQQLGTCWLCDRWVETRFAWRPGSCFTIGDDVVGLDELLAPHVGVPPDVFDGIHGPGHGPGSGSTGSTGGASAEGAAGGGGRGNKPALKRSMQERRDIRIQSGFKEIFLHLSVDDFRGEAMRKLPKETKDKGGPKAGEQGGGAGAGGGAGGGGGRRARASGARPRWRKTRRRRPPPRRPPRRRRRRRSRLPRRRRRGRQRRRRRSGRRRTRSWVTTCTRSSACCRRARAPTSSAPWCLTRAVGA
jgi:Ran GTPase-activating protein (RanGAP) involved in mRNA processing and transport